MSENQPEIEITPPEIWWTTDPEQLSRWKILDIMGNSDIDGNILIKNMESVFQWITEGTMPGESKPKKPSLKVASSRTSDTST